MRSALARHTRVRTDRRDLKRCRVNHRKVVRGLESVGERFSAVLGLDQGEEAVTAAGESLDKAGLFRIVRERRANLVDREVDAVFEIDEGGVRPEVEADLFARDHPAGALSEKLKQAEGLRLQPDERASLAELARTWIEFKRTEAHPGRGGRQRHRLTARKKEWQDSNKIASPKARILQNVTMPVRYAFSLS